MPGLHSTIVRTRSRTTRSLGLLIVSLITVGLASCSSDKAATTTKPTATTADTTAAASVADTTGVGGSSSTDTAAAAGATTAAASADTTAALTVESTASALTTVAGAAVPAISAACAKDSLTTVAAGKLTIGTDKPAYPPWFSNDDPTNGKGFESAVAYAVADTLGFAKDAVTWKTVPFNSSYAPGKKDFDIDINQISITEERKAAVDFSDGYYEVNQAVVALNSSAAANAKSLADLAKLKFGAQVGTTSLDFIKNTIKPSAEAFVYDDTNGAKAALNNKQIDAIVVDLPTAFYITASEIKDSKVVGQFPSAGGGEKFGMLLEKGSKLTACVNEALAVLTSSGKLAAIQEAELATATSAPVFK